MKLIDETGLKHLWQKILSIFSGCAKVVDYQFDTVYDTGDKLNGKPIYLVITHYDSVTGSKQYAGTYYCDKALPEACGTIETTVRIAGNMNVPTGSTFNRVTLPSVNPAGLNYCAALYTTNKRTVRVETGSDRSTCTADVWVWFTKADE